MHKNQIFILFICSFTAEITEYLLEMEDKNTVSISFVEEVIVLIIKLY